MRAGRLNERGNLFLLTGVILVVGFLSTLPVSTTFLSQRNALRLSESSTLYKEIEPILRQTLVEKVLNYIDTIANTGTCATADLPSQWPATFTPAGLSISLLSSSAALTPTYTGDSNHEGAKTRCDTLQTIPATGQSDLSAKSMLYLCFKISETAGAVAAPNILRDGPVFVEASMYFTDLEKNTSLPCQKFKPAASGGSDTRGMAVFYSIYFQRTQLHVAGSSTTGTTQSSFFSHSDTFRAMQ